MTELVNPQVVRWLWAAEAAVIRYGHVTEAQVLAQIAQESGGDPKATSAAGAQGLMQIMPATGRSLGLEDPFDPLQNVMAGVHYMAQAMEQFGTWQLALAAYNAGPGAVEVAGNQVPDIAQTRSYVSDIEAMLPDYSGYIRDASPLPTLREGGVGDSVRLLQRMLGMVVQDQDGIYGPQTLGAVLSAKHESGLPVNGVVADGLWSYLLWKGVRP